MSIRKSAAAVRVPDSGKMELEGVYDSVRSSQARFVASDGTLHPFPQTLELFLIRLSKELQHGEAVTILQDSTELTTAEAARLLSVSRQFLVNLLESGRIPFHMTGTHRRVYARDILRFKAHRDSARRTILDELARKEMEEGLYDRVPLNGKRSGK